MSIEDLLDLWLVLEWIDVPDLKLASESADKEMVVFNLVEECGVLLVVDLLANAFLTSFDVHVADQHLLVVEARDCKDS